MSENYFTKENLDGYLKNLGKEFRKLNGNKIPAEVILVGGASVLLNYGFREKSNDIDAVIHASSAMKDAINRIRDKEDLSNDWLNDDFMRTSSYSSKIRQYAKHYRTFSNIMEVKTISGAYLIAMKLMSGRQYKNDLSDVVGILLEHENTGDKISLDAIKTAAGNLYGDYSNLPEKSRNFIENIYSGDQNLQSIYNDCRNREQHNKSILLGFQKKHPDSVRTSSIDEILSSYTPETKPSGA